MLIPIPTRRLEREFYALPPRKVARSLLGMALLCRSAEGVQCGGWIVETEAYSSKGDSASHSFIGATARNKSMFADAGTLYVYSIHGKYCLNAVTESEGIGSAVLVRALEPQWGVAEMQKRRGCDAEDRRLTGGPARLCQALGVTKNDDGSDLVLGPNIWIAKPDQAFSIKIKESPRIGISTAVDRLWRYFVDGNEFVSGHRGEHSRPARQRLGNNLK